jgi:hypothetical protein
MIFDRYATDFAIDKSPAYVVKEPDNNLAVDLTALGLPFFAGRVRLSQSLWLSEIVTPSYLQIDGLRAAVANVRLNGQFCGSIAWHPYRVDVTGALKEGYNEIEIELAGTLRNLLGPHHQAGGDQIQVHPGSFRDKQLWTDDTILSPFGFDRVILVVR